jgi:hypothetical protein
MRFTIAVLLLVAAWPVAAQEKKAPKIALRDPAEVAKDPAFAIQGEYEGELKLDDGARKVAAQVVARPNGTYVVRFLNGGLPGAGWDGKTQINATAETKDGKVVVSSDKVSGFIEAGKMMISDGMKIEATLSRVERKSPTLGEKPPQGAVVLFEKPEDIEKWKDAQLAELSDGKFLSCSPGKNILTKDAFKDFKSHLEFRLAWMPNSTGQGRSNSGLYLQNRYELQMLDSFALKGENNECGGFYTQFAPSVNMCLPPMVWQTYDIDFKAAEFDKDGKRVKPATVTVVHNGVKIQDNVELKGPTPGGQKEDDKPGPLHLQWHGDPLVYRNIWVVEKK